MTHDSKPSVQSSALNFGSILLDVDIIPFTVKRRSDPSAAFAELMDRFLAATREDGETAAAFASFQERFKGVALEQEDAARLAELEARGAGKLGIEVGSMPLAVGPGLAYMYDAALETLRSTDRPIRPGLIGARAIRMVERSLESTLPILGSMSVSALQLALDDDRFRDRLRERASELGVAYFDDWAPPPGLCEYCIIQIKDKDGQIVSTTCGTKTECELGGGIFLLLLLLGLLGALFDWLF
jgi:hypothetical protein